MQLLYQVELTGDASESALDRFWASLPARESAAREFADSLVRLVLARRDEIDAIIDSAASNWQLDRIARIDLSVLRLAVGELVGCPEVPAEVVIDEAVELARRYSDVDAPSFINGILDRIASEQSRLRKERS